MGLKPKFMFHSMGTGDCGFFTVPGFGHACRGVVHAFTTKPDTPNRTLADIERQSGIIPLFRSIPPHFLTNVLVALKAESSMIRTALQVHGNSVLFLWQKPARFETPTEADGLVTGQRELVLGIATADCIAVLLSDPDAGCVAAVHAGWRGTAARIVSNAVTSMVAKGKADPKRIRAVLGPSVRPCCYEVGSDVIKAMRAALPKRWKEAVVDDDRLDLAAANRIQLEEAGVPLENIFELDLCTSCNPTLFHSYRRDGKKAGRQIALIGMKPA